jgi:hypothetical protein
VDLVLVVELEDLGSGEDALAVGLAEQRVDLDLQGHPVRSSPELRTAFG